jgi:heat shock protein HtpX
MYNQIEANKRRTVYLMIIFVTFVITLAYFIGYFMGDPYSITILAIVISLIMTLTSYFSGDKIALKTAGAKEIKKEDNPYVYRMVENLCITAGMPLPKVHIIQDPAPNAFATGRDPEHASIALTTGLIERLENEELEGVIAHELAHVQNYDIRIMTVVIVLVGIVALMSDLFLRMTFWGGGNRRSSGNAGAVMAIIGIALMILSPLIAKLIQLAVSRKREYLADASGSLLTRYPQGLANALEKISQHKQPMRRASTAIEHLYIASPFFGAKKFAAKLFSTHPPIADRIKKLREMA